MKTLTDKIFDAIRRCRDEQYNEFTRGQLDRLLPELIILEKEADFEEVGRVMMKHLGNTEKYHSHYTVITTNSTCELVEGQRSVGQVMDYVPD